MKKLIPNLADIVKQNMPEHMDVEFIVPRLTGTDGISLPCLVDRDNMLMLQNRCAIPIQVRLRSANFTQSFRWWTPAEVCFSLDELSEMDGSQVADLWKKRLARIEDALRILAGGEPCQPPSV